MTTFSDTPLVSQLEQVQRDVHELRQAWRASGWIDAARDTYRMIRPEPQGMNARQDFSNVIASALGASVARMTEYVSTHVQHIHENYVGRVASTAPRVECTVIGSTEAERQKQELLTAWGVGILNEQNLRTSTYGRGTGFVRRVIEYSGCPGKIVGLVHVKRLAGKKAWVDWQLFDPLTVYHDFDSWPRRFVRDFSTGAKNAQRILTGMGMGMKLPAEINEEKDEPVVITEWWMEEPVESSTQAYQVYRAYLVNNKPVSAPWLTAFRRLPIIISCVNAGTSSYRDFTLNQSTTQGSSSTVGALGGTEIRGMASTELRYHAQSFYSSLIHSHNMYQQFMSLTFQGLAAELDPARYYISEDGGWVLKPEQHTPGASIAMTNTQRIEREQSAIHSIHAALDLFERRHDKERAEVYNPVLLGESNPGDAGYLNNLKSGHARINTQESARGVAVFLKLGILEALRQFTETDLVIDLDGEYKDGFKTKEFHYRDVSRRDFPDNYVIDVDVPVEIPQDTYGRLLYYMQGTSSGAFSKVRGRSQILDIQDAELEQKLIDGELLEARPEIQALKLIDKVLEKVEAAQMEARRAKTPATRVAASVKVRALSLQLVAIQRMVMGAGGQAQAQPQAPGTPPSVNPNENSPQNSDVQAQAEGRVSSNLTGGGRRRTQP